MTYPSGYLNVLPVWNGTTGLQTGAAAATANAALIQAAINGASANNGPIVFPWGSYYTAPLTMAPGVTLIGAGMGGYGPALYQPNVDVTTTLNLVSGSTSPLINIPVNTPDVTIRDIQLNGGTHADSPNASVIVVADAGGADQTNLRLERVMMLQGGKYNLYVGPYRDDVKVHHCEIMYAYSHGLFTKAPDGVYDSCEFGSNGQDGVSQNIVVGAVVNRFTNNDIWSSTTPNQTAQIGIYIESGITGIVISGNGIDRHNKQGIYVDSGCYSISIMNNVFHSNSQATKGMYSHVFNNSGHAGGVMFDGNVATVDGGLFSASYLLGTSGTQASGQSQVGSCNYTTVTAGGTQGGVETGLFGYSVTN